jgi:hypothetical protein
MCNAPIWEVTPAERTNAISTSIVMIGVIDLSTSTIPITRTGTTTSGTARMVSAIGDMTDPIQKGLGVEVPASATGDTRRLPRHDNRQWSVACRKLIGFGRGGPMQ